jgi:hypothetical protein
VTCERLADATRADDANSHKYSLPLHFISINAVPAQKYRPSNG